MIGLLALIDLGEKAQASGWIPALILIVHVAAGAALYLGYGIRDAKLRAACPPPGIDGKFRVPH